MAFSEKERQGFESFACFPLQNIAHDGMQNPAEISRTCGELKPICRERSSWRVGVPNACCEFSEKGWIVDHFYGRYFTGFEGEIFCLDADASSQRLANAEGSRTLLCDCAAASQSCLAQQGVPFEAPRVVMQEGKYFRRAAWHFLRDGCCWHGW